MFLVSKDDDLWEIFINVKKNNIKKLEFSYKL